jgi:AcrR family transcriptional regulator
MSEQPETKRGPGRPRSFDPDQALDAAIGLFWAKGYDATSLDDLGAAMGMGRPSIYRAFGSKDQLFLMALARYGDTVAAGPVAALQAAASVDDAITGFLNAIVDYATADPAHRGCLIGSIASAVDDDGARNFTAQALGDVEAAVAARLARAVADGELPTAYDVAAGARRAVDNMMSLSTRARYGTAVDELLATIPDRVALVLVHN